MAAILQDLFVQTNTGVAVVDRSHCIVAWNPGAERLFGWLASEVQGQDVVRLLASKGSGVRRYIGAALMGDVVQAVPVLLKHRSGDLVELLLTCRGSATHPTAAPVAVLFIDPTPRQQTIATTLAQRTRELQRIIGAFPDLFFWTDPDGRVLDFQMGSEVNLPVPAEEFLGHRVTESFGGDAGRRLQAAIRTCLVEHRNTAVEYTLPLSSGTGHFEARVVPIAPNRFVAVVRNVTAQRRLEEELRRVSKMEAIGRLSGSVAHDFNNLLTVVEACAAGLREELPGNGHASELLDELLTATHKASALVRHLLAFSQRQPASPRAVNLNALVSDNVQLLTRLLSKDITLSLDSAPDAPWVFADPVQLEQVLYNLCANARDAMPNGGRLTIRTERRPATAALVVSDTGVGMNPETIEHAFEPFFTTKQERGTGLGLATVHGIVNRAGGRIEIASSLGNGTTFTVLLPSRDAPDVEPSDAGTTLAPAADGTETVLVVDDDADVRRVLIRRLSKRGYEVLEADGVETALQVYRAHRPHIRLVITDVAMPGGSGHALVEELRRNHPALPIVMLTGHHEGSRPEDAPRLPGVVTLRKPPAFDELLRVVRSVLDASTPSRKQ
jgi:PAS domain S-box-containing protein